MTHYSTKREMRNFDACAYSMRWYQAVARIFGMLVEHRPTGLEHTAEGFNVDLWRTYLCRPE